MSASVLPAPVLPLPNRPKRPLPPGACDTHAHIFGPADKFPFVLDVPYVQPNAPYEAYRAMLDHVGIARGVLVTPVTYRFDNRSVIDACTHAPETIRGVGVVGSEETTDAMLRELVQANVIGLRFSEIRSDSESRYGAAGLPDFHKLAPRMKQFGLHCQAWAYADTLAADAERMLAHGVPVVIDHLTRPDVAKGANAPGFQRLVSLVREGRIWVKLAVPRVGLRFPNYEDARPFHDAMIAANPDRLTWGSDWPHVRQGDRTPDVGHQLDLFDEWIGHDETLRQKILVDNPRRLYGFA